MPEFILSHGSPEASRAYHLLDYFTQGYIEAMFFTDASDPDDGDLQDATFSDLAPETLTAIIADCAKFQEDNRADLDEAIDDYHHGDEACGRDFWYTRNGHGCGFWDGDLGDELGGRLTKACKQWPEVSIYRGDDGLVWA